MNNFESLKSYFSSELILIVGIVVLLILAMTKSARESRTAVIVTSVVLIFSLVATVGTHFEKGLSLFHGMIVMDTFGQFFKVIIGVAAILTVILCTKSADLKKAPTIEFYAFLLSLVLGLNMMAVSGDLIMIYLSIEMASIMSYIMAGYLSEDKRSEEAGLKYVLYGGVASGIMIFGMSLLYGLTGSLNLVGIREYLMANATDRLVLFITFIFILAGLGYKMAIAPFHMWSPDVYEGAPMPVTAFLSVASKAAGFAVTLRFFLVGFILIEKDGTWGVLKTLDWQSLIAWLAAITMTVGNVLAIQQHNVKRFLAYSSVAHAGYMLMGLAAQTTSGVESILFYVMVYLLMNLGAFFVVSLVANQHATEEMDQYKGLARQGIYGLFLSLSMAIFLFSLAGLPPFAGFVGKWYVFKAVLDAKIYWLAVVGAVNAVISLFYYVKLAKFMLVDEPNPGLKVVNDAWRLTSVIAVCVVLTVCFGLYFAPLVRWAQASANMYY